MIIILAHSSYKHGYKIFIAAIKMVKEGYNLFIATIKRVKQGYNIFITTIRRFKQGYKWFMTTIKNTLRGFIEICSANFFLCGLRFLRWSFRLGEMALCSLKKLKKRFEPHARTAFTLLLINVLFFLSRLRDFGSLVRIFGYRRLP